MFCIQHQLTFTSATSQCPACQDGAHYASPPAPPLPDIFNQQSCVTCGTLLQLMAPNQHTNRYYQGCPHCSEQSTHASLSAADIAAATALASLHHPPPPPLTTAQTLRRSQGTGPCVALPPLPTDSLPVGQLHQQMLTNRIVPRPVPPVVDPKIHKSKKQRKPHWNQSLQSPEDFHKAKRAAIGRRFHFTSGTRPDPGNKTLEEWAAEQKRKIEGRMSAIERSRLRTENSGNICPVCDATLTSTIKRWQHQSQCVRNRKERFGCKYCDSICSSVVEARNHEQLCEKTFYKQVKKQMREGTQRIAPANC